MNTPQTLIAICACALSLGACDKTPTTPPSAPTPMVNNPVPIEPAAPTVADPSLPSAESVFPTATPTHADPTPGRPDGTRKPSQEAMGTVIPGQNNDHSAPLAPAQAASTP